MLRKHVLRRAAVLALLLALSGPLAPAWAAGAGGSPGGGWSWPGLGTLWAKVTALLTPQITCDKGSSIDPDGRCLTGLASTSSDKGLAIDPNG